jgi:hypothetical protein
MQIRDLAHEFQRGITAAVNQMCDRIQTRLPHIIGFPEDLNIYHSMQAQNYTLLIPFSPLLCYTNNEENIYIHRQD